MQNLVDTLQIASLGQNTMTLAIPPGRQKFPRQNSRTPACSQSESGAQTSKQNEVAQGSPPPNIQKKDVEILPQAKMQNDQPNDSVLDADPVLGKVELGWEMTPPKDEPDIGTASSTAIDLDSSNTPPLNDVILLEMKNLKQLNDKIIELDGRLDPKNQKEAPAVSPWKLIRAKRNNQDLGTLFEMREDFYVYKVPQITKTLNK